MEILAVKLTKKEVALFKKERNCTLYDCPDTDCYLTLIRGQMTCKDFLKYLLEINKGG